MEEIHVFTKAQRTVLIGLWDVATHENRPVILKNKYHSAAMALVRLGLVNKIDRGFYRPLYELTEAGREYCRDHNVEEWL